MGVQLPRPASAASSIGAYARQSPATTGPPPSFGPRGPVAPVASNAPLLSPLVPTNTGFSNFIPTRPGGLMAQPTGFQQPMATGFQQPMPTGFQPMATGYQPQMQQPMQTGFVPPMPPPQLQTAPSFLQSQPTGFGGGAPAPLQAQMTGFAPGGIRQWSPQPPPAQPPATSSTPVDRYQPQNVFASMKTMRRSMLRSL